MSRDIYNVMCIVVVAGGGGVAKSNGGGRKKGHRGRFCISGFTEFSGSDSSDKITIVCVSYGSLCMNATQSLSCFSAREFHSQTSFLYPRDKNRAMIIYHQLNHLADVRSRMVNMNMSLAGSLRGAQKESTVSRLLRGAKDDGESG